MNEKELNKKILETPTGKERNKLTEKLILKLKDKEIDRLTSIGKEVQNLLIKHKCSIYDTKIICEMILTFADSDLKEYKKEMKL